MQEAVDVSRETQEKLHRFVDLFQKWARTINLVAPSTLSEVWNRHVRDSLQLRTIVPGPARWIDIGSGGGFPGIVIAIALTETGEGWVDLVESNKKKCSFLRMALLESQARGAVHPLRIEDAVLKLEAPDVISARALAELDKLFDYVFPWVEKNRNLKLVFHKGRDYLAEIEKARGRWRFDLVVHQSVVEADSVILEISSLQRL
ncbi:16S rRNA (guanine(527)-N(7))-methyltransferase RsmG [Rhizobium sp. AAP43]|uniref:16S rRNA (guanine(527)-N(7))-methyltransferase RsmG n=1 Tax=Rhizobium sp. AAP43 TaxID=1523420 RepID=UPI0006B9F7B0|nr:16S rRNA (guanine(527)-N(7))-methyltransferase RsmG [Rhizobium sp. AAP43]KPF42887.1 16S rRNA (guanine(527)-N(7))-methyltransferase RsmG [Rhizobium sp. AAP43]